MTERTMTRARQSMPGMERPRRFRETALVAIAIGVSLCLATTASAQRKATTTIVGTAHDFSASGPGYHVPSGNHCAVCHGVPGIGSSAPVWNHTLSSNSYDGADWLFAIGDGTDELGDPTPFSPMAASPLTKKCLGCHEGNVAIDDYAGQMVGTLNAASLGDTDLVGTGTTFTVDFPGTGPKKIKIYQGGVPTLYDIATITDNTHMVIAAPGLTADIPAGTKYHGIWYGPVVDSTGDLFDVMGADLSVHHPVDITYNATLAAAQGALEDPTTFLNPQGGGTIDQTLLKGHTLTCNSCHEQHNDRRFDLVGGDPYDDPKGWSGSPPVFDKVNSEKHKFLIIDRSCFNCHTHEQPHDGVQHHIPGRTDPFGDARGSNMHCDLCHYINRGIAAKTGIPDDANKGGGYAACSDCHRQGVRRVPGGFADIPGGHHGGSREKPYFDCAACHADPLTGILTGNDFGTLKAPSCYKCHDDMWNTEPGPDGRLGTDDDVSTNRSPRGLYVDGTNPSPKGGPGTPGTGTTQLVGTVDEAMTFEAIVDAIDPLLDPEGDDILAYQWSFGDGTTPPMPSHEPTISHTFDDFSYSTRGPIYNVTVSVTDGFNPPIYYTFQVKINDVVDEPVADKWAVDVTPLSSAVPPVVGPEDFDITFETHSGSLVGIKDDHNSATKDNLSLGVEFVGVIYWMEMWMDLAGNTYWGTGDMYFGNVDRRKGEMSGVVFKADGSVKTFTAKGGASGH